MVGGGAFGRRVRRAWARLGRREETGDPVGDFRAPRHDVSDANSTRRFGPRVRSPTTRVGWVLVKRRTVTFVDDRMPRALFFSPSSLVHQPAAEVALKKTEVPTKFPSRSSEICRAHRAMRGGDDDAMDLLRAASSSRARLASQGVQPDPPTSFTSPRKVRRRARFADMATLLAEGVSSLPFPSPGSSSRASRSCA